MIRAIPFATSLAAAAAVFYVLCALVVWLAPGLALALLQTWAHGLDVSVLATTAPLVTPLGFVVGLVTWTAITWLFGAGWAALYNALSASREVGA